MFITKKHMSRRSFMRGCGGALALPLLDSMVPAQTSFAGAVPARKPQFGNPYPGLDSSWGSPTGGQSDGAHCLAKVLPTKTGYAGFVMNNHPGVWLPGAVAFGVAVGNPPPEDFRGAIAPEHSSPNGKRDHGRESTTAEGGKPLERDENAGGMIGTPPPRIRDGGIRLPSLGLHLDEIGKFCDDRLFAMVQAVQKIGFWPVFAISLLLLSFAGFTMLESQGFLRDIIREFLRFVATLEVATILVLMARWLVRGVETDRDFSAPVLVGA